MFRSKMTSDRMSFLAVVLCLTAATPGCQALCQAGEVEVVTMARCDIVITTQLTDCLGDRGSPLPETVRSIQPVSSPDPSVPCFYVFVSSGEIRGVSSIRGVCEAKVTSCVADQGTGGTGGEGPCLANETAVVTPAGCVSPGPRGGFFCVGDGGLELPGSVRSFEAAPQGDCGYGIVSPTQLLAFGSFEVCDVNVTSCVAGQGTGGTDDDDTANSDSGDCSNNGDRSDSGGRSDSGDSSDTGGSNESR